MELDYVGMLALGAFVGGIVTYGLHFIQGYANFAKAITTILAASLSGTVVLFIDKLNSGRALGAYCIGLLVALMWAYVSVALRHLKSKNPSFILLGWLHIAGVVVVTIIAAALVLPPAFGRPWTPRANAVEQAGTPKNP